MTFPPRIVVFGNAGSGKSTLARSLAAEHDLALLSMDDIAWSESAVRRPIGQSVAMLHAFLRSHDRWVVEGCYGDLIEAALPHCNDLRFLNPGVEACVARCRGRAWEPDKFATMQEQNAMLDALVQWVREYDTRDDEFGLRRHRAIYDRFTGPKREYGRDAPTPARAGG